MVDCGYPTPLGFIVSQRMPVWLAWATWPDVTLESPTIGGCDLPWVSSLSFVENLFRDG